MQILIPTTPFAARCLRYEEGRASVIDLSARHYLTSLLCVPPNVRNVSKAAAKYCTEQVVFNLPKRIARQLSKRHAGAVGYLLHQHYMQQMLHALHHAHGLTNQQVMPLLKTYLHLRGVTEDDFALDAAYKAWQRYQVKHSPKGQTLEKNACTDAPAIVTKCKRMKLASEWVMERILSGFKVERAELHGPTLPTTDQHAQRAALLFVLHRLTSHSYRSLAVEFGISKQSVYRNVKTVELAYTHEHSNAQTVYVEIMRSTLMRVKSPISHKIISANL